MNPKRCSNCWKKGLSILGHVCLVSNVEERAKMMSVYKDQELARDVFDETMLNRLKKAVGFKKHAQLRSRKRR